MLQLLMPWGATIGINTMLLLSSVFYMLQEQVHEKIQFYRKQIGGWINISNIALLVFWLSLIGSGLVQISGRLNNKGFYEIMNNCAPYFRVFLISGIVVMAGLAVTAIIVIRLIIDKRKLVKFMQATH